MSTCAVSRILSRPIIEYSTYYIFIVLIIVMHSIRLQLFFLVINLVRVIIILLVISFSLSECLIEGLEL